MNGDWTPSAVFVITVAVLVLALYAAVFLVSFIGTLRQAWRTDDIVDVRERLEPFTNVRVLPPVEVERDGVTFRRTDIVEAEGDAPARIDAVVISGHPYWTEQQITAARTESASTGHVTQTPLERGDAS